MDELSLPPHIARIDFVEFYIAGTGSRAESQRLEDDIDSIENIDRRQTALVARNQGARMLWLADRMDDLATGRPALNILFYFIAAEAVAKLLDRFTDEGFSRRYVREFFSRWCTEDHRRRLARAFATTRGSWENAVDYLYDLRCDVAHEGKYFNFHLPDPGGLPVGNGSVIAYMPLAELRQIVIEGIVNGVRQVVAGS